MKKIYKYTLEVTDTQTLEMPNGSKLLTIQNQNNDIVLWVECDPNAKLVNYNFLIIGTGFELPLLSNQQDYLDTVQIGRLVWHIYSY